MKGYSEYRILTKKDEKIGRINLRFNGQAYVSLELWGAGRAYRQRDLFPVYPEF
jgi:hypothetical protein